TGPRSPPRVPRFFPPPRALAAAPPAGRVAPGLAARSPPRLAGVGDERCQLPAERGGVGGAQVDLVAGAADGELHRLIGRAAVQVVLQGDGYLLGHAASRCLVSDISPYKIGRADTVTATPS